VEEVGIEPKPFRVQLLSKQCCTLCKSSSVLLGTINKSRSTDIISINIIMTTYLSPLVSCIHCREIKSAKGIHSHYLTVHTDNGKFKLDLARKNSNIASLVTKNKNKEDKINLYKLSPKYCKKCNNSLEYHQRNYKFCSTSCAALHNNTLRDPRSEESREKSRKAMTPALHSKIKFCICKFCLISFIWNSVSKGSKMFCSRKCHSNYSSIGKSDLAKKRGLGGVRQSKKILYNGVHLGSSYELTIAKSLDEHSIKWIIPKRIPYIDPFGKERTYAADFFLPKYNLYLDPKNDFLINNVNPTYGFTDAEKIKCVMIQNNIKILIISKPHLSWNSISNWIISNSNNFIL
jgi:hypothetical protein